MFIEFDLKGSRCQHRGVFDTTGFWARFEPEIENGTLTKERGLEWIPTGFKIFSHFSFAYFHEDIGIANMVYMGLIGALNGIDWNDPEIGFIREVC